MGALMNVPLLRKAAAAYLGIMDQKQFPEKFNTDELQAVYCVGGPQVPLTLVDARRFSGAIAGAAAESFILVAADTNDPNPMLSPFQDILIDEIQVFLTMNLADVATMAGKLVTLNINKYITIGNPVIYQFYDNAVFKLTAGKTGYVWTLRGWSDENQSSFKNHDGRAIFVPKGKRLDIGIQTTDGSLWPASAQWDVSIIGYTDGGMGTLRPI
jgi:hypothetical protein